MPDLTGRVAIVTGANRGLGSETTRALARKGALVVLACRDLERANAALERIRGDEPQAALEVLELDLASLASVRRFAESFAARYPALNILCNNAGVMALPYRQTADGFEMQFGTNHLGHFALTGLLLPHLLQAGDARIVTISSSYHRLGRMRFGDLNGRQSYGRWAAYAQSKLANLLFAYELQRKLEARGAEAISVAAHPGYAATELQLIGPRMEGSALRARLMGISNRLLAQSAAMGALPMLYAATAPGVRGGDYIGPAGFMQQRGHPKRTRSSPASYDRELAVKLWAVSEELTGVTYPL